MACCACKGRPCALEPDRGYAIVIAALSFIIHILIYGVCWSVGVFYVVFLEQFDSPKWEIALITSLNTAITFGSGPISSILTNKFGCRIVTMIGGLVAALGLFATGFATNVYHLYLTFGILTGLGLGIAYIPAIAVVGFYFERYRSVALGIVVSGVGVGTMLFPIIINALIDTYGWRGSLIMQGGIFLHVCIMGALFFPLPDGDCDNESIENYIKEEDKIESDDPNNQINQNMVTNQNVRLIKSESKLKTMSLDNIAHFGNRLAVPSVSMQNIRNKKSSMDNILFHRNVKASVDNLSMYSTKSARIKKSMENVTIHGLSGSIVLHYPEPQEEGTTVETPNEKPEIFNLKILKNSGYIMLMFNNFFVLFGISVIYVHIVAYALDQGYSGQQGRTLLSVIGITNFVGRIIYGILATHQKLKPMYLFMGSLGGCAVVIGLVPLIDNFYIMITLCGFFGFLTASLGTLLPQMLIEILGLRYLASSYGYILIFEAAGSMLGAPTASYLYEATQYYPASMYLGAASFAVSVLFMIWPVKQVYFDASKKKEEKSDIDYKICLPEVEA